MAQKKGFGAANEPAPKKKKKQASSPSSSATASPLNPPPTTAATVQVDKVVGEKPAVVSEQSTTTSTTAATSTATSTTSTTTLNAGQRALEKLRREQAEKKDAELRRIRDLLKEDEQVQETPAAIPEKVAQRMGQRMLPFVGLPLFLGMGSFVAFWYFATYQNVQFEPALVATATVFILVSGLLGITYSVISASWDPDREGSFLGVEEFQRNMKNIQEGLSRSRENTLLREQMSGLSGDELQRALLELERKEQAEAKRKQSLQNKLQDELK